MLKLCISLILFFPIIALTLHLLIFTTKNSIRQYIQTILSLTWLALSISALLMVNYPLKVSMGGWVAPFGITLVINQLSCVMLVVFATVAMSINFYSYSDLQIEKKQQAFYAGFWLLLLGVSGSLLTADIFNLYVWFEVILVSAFILLTSSQQPKPKAIMQYALINITGTLLMLLSIALIYGAFGTLNYAGIAERLLQNSSNWTLPILCLLLFSIGIKGAMFPLYFWLPNAYPKTSVSSTMLLSSLITKTVMIVLLRLAWLWKPLHDSFLSHSLIWIALSTMLFGVLGAASQLRFKNILAFHIISQLGYILLAIALPIPIAIIAAIYFLIHNVFVKTNLFMIAGVIEQHLGTDDLKKLGHVLKKHLWISIAFFLSAMSLAGFPPLSGFWGKFLVIRATLAAHSYIGATTAIFVSLFTLYSMIKIWRYVFCQEAIIKHKIETKPLPFSFSLNAAILPLLMLPILMGLYPDFILKELQPTVQQLSHPESYISLVLGRSL